MALTTNRGQNSENKKVDIQEVIINSPVVSLFLLGSSVQIPTDVLKGILEEYVNRNGAIKSDSFFVGHTSQELNAPVGFCAHNEEDYNQYVMIMPDEYVKGWKFKDYVAAGFKIFVSENG